MPLAIDLYCGLGGWTEGLLAEGWDVVGFDIEQHVYGEYRYPAQLVIQDVRTLHGSQFRTADLIVASPPCQEYSYMAMPWTRAKALAADYREGRRDVKRLTALFDACFRIQREACEAAGRHIPMVVENVKGAQPWVGRARWHFGSFYLWGDVPALMPRPMRAFKASGMNWSDQTKRGQDFTRIAGEQAIKNSGGSWFNIGSPGQTETGRNLVHALSGVKQRGSGHAWFDKALDERRKNPEGLKNPGIELGDIGFNVASAHRFGHMVEGVKIARSTEDKRQHIGTKRKFASAMIAKIPLALSRHIAAIYLPERMAA